MINVEVVLFETTGPSYEHLLRIQREEMRVEGNEVIEIYSAAKLFSFPGLKKPMNMDGESVKKSRRRLGTEGSVDVGTE